MACKDCADKKEDKMHSQLIEHNKSVQNNNANLMRQNTQLHAQLNHLKSEHENFKKSVHEKLEKTIKHYDNCNSKIHNFLLSKGLGKILTVDDMDTYMGMYPIKLGEKENGKG